MWLSNECLSTIQKAQGSTPGIKIAKIQLQGWRDAQWLLAHIALSENPHQALHNRLNSSSKGSYALSGFYGYLHSCASMPQRHIKKIHHLGHTRHIVHRLNSHMVPVTITTSKVQGRKILSLQKVLLDKTALHQQYS